MTRDPQPADEPLPPWLRDASIEPDDDAPAPDAAPVRPNSATTALRDLIARTPNRPAAAGDAEVPIWLQNLLDTPDPAEHAAAPPPAADDADLATTPSAGGDQPAEVSAAEPAAPGTTRQLESRSAGAVTDLPIVEAGPVDPAILASIATPALTGGRYTPVQIQAIERLRAITAQSADMSETDDDDDVPQRTWRITIEQVLSVLVLVLVIAAVGLPMLSAPFRHTLPAGAASSVSDGIAALGAGDVVLLAYEWDARRTAELAPIERAMLDQLAERGVGLVLFSSDPQGVLPQFAAQEYLAASGDQPAPNPVVALGYRPGGSAALALLARTFPQLVAEAAPDGMVRSGSDTPIAALGDLSAIIVFADDPADVQGWMEQVYPGIARAATPIPLTLVVTADASVMAAPYARQPGVTLLAGPLAAASYQAARGDADDAQPLAAVRLVTLGLGVVLAMLALTASIAAVMRRRSTP